MNIRNPLIERSSTASLGISLYFFPLSKCKQYLNRLLRTVLLISLLVGCASNNSRAPVVSGWREPYEKQGAYTVQQGDNLYTVAWRFGYDYKELAKVNHLSAPYAIFPGQKLYLVPPKLTDKSVSQHQKIANQSQQSSTKSIKTVQNKQKSNMPNVRPRQSSDSQWVWPVKGNIVKPFSTGNTINKGIDISGKEGTPIIATASGKVVYSGSGLTGYGNLIIIRHKNNYLSAYAHNKQNLAKEGTYVQGGQRIATMGHTGTDSTSLHFEIRRNGKAIDPLLLLPKSVP